MCCECSSGLDSFNAPTSFVHFLFAVHGQTIIATAYRSNQQQFDGGDKAGKLNLLAVQAIAYPMCTERWKEHTNWKAAAMIRVA